MIGNIIVSDIHSQHQNKFCHHPEYISILNGSFQFNRISGLKACNKLRFFTLKSQNPPKSGKLFSVYKCSSPLSNLMKSMTLPVCTLTCTVSLTLIRGSGYLMVRPSLVTMYGTPLGPVVCLVTLHSLYYNKWYKSSWLPTTKIQLNVVFRMALVERPSGPCSGQ